MEAGSSTLKDVNNPVQEDDVPVMASWNEAHTEKESTATTTCNDRLEMEEEEVSSKANDCFNTRLCEKMTPEGGWRRKVFMSFLVAVLAMMILSVCSLPTILYFSALVRMPDYTKGPCMYKATVLF